MGLKWIFSLPIIKLDHLMAKMIHKLFKFYPIDYYHVVSINRIYKIVHLPNLMGKA